MTKTLQNYKVFSLAVQLFSMWILHYVHKQSLLLLLPLAVLHLVQGHALEDIKVRKKIVIQLSGPEEIGIKTINILQISFLLHGLGWLRAIPSFYLRSRIRAPRRNEKHHVWLKKQSNIRSKNSFQIHEVSVMASLVQSLYLKQEILSKLRKYGNAKYISRRPGHG